jgi:hypothetical protein
MLQVNVFCILREPIAKLLLPVIPAKAGIQKLLFLVETGFPDQVGE